MGNAEQKQLNIQKQKGQVKASSQKFLLEVRDRQIVLDYTNKIKLTIGDIMSFPSGGYEGLHLWDSNIILARYVLINRQQFHNKSVIQLLSGTGIGSIALKKFASTSKVVATDRKQQVVDNIVKNCQRNEIDVGLIAACISWSEYKDYKAKFDFVLGADLLFKNSPVQLLLAALAKLLVLGGKAYIIAPYRKNDDESGLFVQKIDKQVFKYKKQKLVDEIYMDSPLLNQVQGYQQYKDISEGYFHLYTLEKIVQKQPHLVHQLQKSPKPHPNSHSPSKNQQQNQIKIKTQHLEEHNQKQQIQQKIKQLQIVKIKKKQDKPEYQRNKTKNIVDIIAASQDQNQEKINPNGNEGQQDQIVVVEKQHELFNQPAKRSQSDCKSIGSNNRDPNEKQETIQIEKIRMRNKSNHN